MRVVNLARRPFFNRRPVSRAALLLWVVGGLLLLVNFWLWGSHFRGSSVSTGKLAALDRQVAEEEQALDDYWQLLRSVGLRSRNQKADYLNLLIHRRTFPWSRLFDELEAVLPDNVYLLKVQPNVKLAKEPKQRRSRSSRALTPRQARRRSRGGDAVEPTARSRPSQEPQAAVAAPQDKVTLAITGIARTEEAMFDLVDRLYGHASFLDPSLSRESTDGSKVEFNIRVSYLMPQRETFPVRVEELPPEEGAEDSQTGASQAEGSEGSPDSGAPQQTAAVAGEEAGGDAEDDPAAGVLEQRGPGFVGDALAARRERSEARSIERGERGPIRRAGPDGEVEGEDPQRRAARPGALPTAPGGANASAQRAPSRVSVAPERRRNRGRTQSDQGLRNEPSASSSSEPERRQGRARNQDSEDQTLDPPENQRPAASASPRLFGTLHLPDFLKPERLFPGTLIPETSSDGSVELAAVRGGGALDSWVRDVYALDSPRFGDDRAENLPFTSASWTEDRSASGFDLFEAPRPPATTEVCRGEGNAARDGAIAPECEVISAQAPRPPDSTESVLGPPPYPTHPVESTS